MRTKYILKTIYYWIRYRALLKSYNAFDKFTMIPRDTYIRNMRLAKRFQPVTGDVVECGTWKGGMIAGIAKYYNDPKRRYYLFDSFEGLPIAKEIDGYEAIKWQKNTSSQSYFDNCSADISYAAKAMELSNAQNTKIVKGWFSETLPLYKTLNIALLRLDGDWYESTMDCLNSLFDQVVPGGIIIIDDYYTWEGCTKAVHDFLSKNQSSCQIRQLENDICYLIKK